MNNPPPALSQSRAVFIGNIPYQVTEPQLVQLFSTIGPIINFRMMFDKETGKK